MKTILVTDPRQPIQELLEQVLTRQGYDVAGPAPDLVLTPDETTARFWSRRGVPVWNYDYEPLQLSEVMVMVEQLLDAGTDGGG